MVANQELLASFPAESLHAAIDPSHAAHGPIDEMRGELEKPAPNTAAVRHHVDALRSIRELEAIVANWWDSPAIQQIILDLTEIGL